MTEESVVFAVALSDRDWDSGVSGWRCGALAIPGAYVDKLYVKGRQADTATYEVAQKLGVIRWLSKPKPDEATVALQLTKRLETTDVGRFWRIFALFVPILTAVVSSVLTWYFGNSKPLAADWEKWEISGKVDVATTKIPYHLVTIGLEPPNSRLNHDGSFELAVPVQLDSDVRKFPRIFFSPVTEDLQPPPVVHILDTLKMPGQYAGVFDYRPSLDYQNKRVTIQEIARYRRKDDKVLGVTVYDPRAAEKAEVNRDFKLPTEHTVVAVQSGDLWSQEGSCV